MAIGDVAFIALFAEAVGSGAVADDTDHPR